MKTGLRGFRPGPIQTRLYNHTRLEASNFGFRKQRDCTIRIAKTKALISFAVTAKLICAFVFAYSKNLFSHDAAHLLDYANLIVNIGEINSGYKLDYSWRMSIEPGHEKT